MKRREGSRREDMNGLIEMCDEQALNKDNLVKHINDAISNIRYHEYFSIVNNIFYESLSPLSFDFHHKNKRKTTMTIMHNSCLNHILDLFEGTDNLNTQIINGGRCVKMIILLKTIEKAPRE